MKYLLVGGGSGGHLTPLLAVASSLKQQDSNATVIHVGQKGDKLGDVAEHRNIDKSMTITAGKFRRYHGESFLQHLFDVKTIFLNIRDFFKFLIGVVQAWILLGRVKPNVIFLKGGFVCVPVGFAARLRRIPYITHDSDAVPGLANRLTAKHAIYNTTALEPANYPYDQSKTIKVGIPIQQEYVLVTTDAKDDAKLSLNIEKEVPVILSVGGGLGAQRLNRAIVDSVKILIDKKITFKLLHLSGRALYDETVNLYKENVGSKYPDYVNVIDFSKELYNLSAAADVVITRAGATNIAEFAVQAKACIVVPNPVLTGGQQLHNAKILEENGSAVIIQEDSLNRLPDAVLNLLEDENKRQNLSESLNKLAVEKSADKIANILREITSK